MRYEILPHTADGKFRAYGATLEEAFANAALATASLMWDWAQVEPRLEIPVDLRGRDHEQLLVKFLGEIVYLLDTRKFLLAGVEGLRIDEAPAVPLRLTARLRGDTLTERSEIYGAVKAVTYNELKIERCACGAAGPEGGSGGYAVQVVVDM